MDVIFQDIFLQITAVYLAISIILSYGEFKICLLIYTPTYIICTYLSSLAQDQVTQLVVIQLDEDYRYLL